MFPWITRDLKDHDKCDFDTFLKYVLDKVDLNDELDANERLENTLEALLPLCNAEDFQGFIGE